MSGRPQRDGTKARAPRKTKLTTFYIKTAPKGLTWDTEQKGLALMVEPTGHKTFKVVYSFHGRARWYHLNAVNAIALSDARKMAGEIMIRVMRGEDPQAERRAQRSAGTFAELARRYVDEHAKKHNKSWKQAADLVQRLLVPRWAKLQSAGISRDDVKRMMHAVTASSPTTANQTLAAASAIFSWAVKEGIDGVKVNPCSKVDRNKTHSRERVLSDSELPAFWSAFDPPLRAILLTGQRPGEVVQMRWEHIKDGWWELSGRPIVKDGKTVWSGTKNGKDHRVWLPAPMQALLKELDQDTEYVFTGQRGKLDQAMRDICTDLKIGDRVKPHDLRRTHGTKITALGFGRDAMNRVQNHKEGGIASVYDRHGYADENKRIMEAVASHIVALATGTTDDKVVPMRKPKRQ